MPDHTKQEEDIIASMFYIPPTEVNKVKFQRITDEAQRFAAVIIENVPPCADRSHALRQLRDIRMWCNAAISLEGLI